MLGASLSIGVSRSPVCFSSRRIHMSLFRFQASLVVIRSSLVSWSHVCVLSPAHGRQVRGLATRARLVTVERTTLGIAQLRSGYSSFGSLWTLPVSHVPD
jgi:hypothetical protein